MPGGGTKTPEAAFFGSRILVSKTSVVSAAKTSALSAAKTSALSAAKTSALSAAMTSALPAAKTSAISHISISTATTCARRSGAHVVALIVEM